MTDYNYFYTREKVDGVYDINNPAREDGEGNRLYLAQEVKTALPGTIFKLICSGAEAKFIFTTELSGADETTLTNTVNAHKNNT